MAKGRKPVSEAVTAAADAAERRSKGVTETEPRAPVDPPAPLPAPPRATVFPIVSPGRTPKYKAKFAEIAKGMCRMGATDADLAAEFGVTTVTIWRWQSKHKAF